ncbi:GNAT family N-acetyltransferase [Streptomyces yangpuensis]|uniref:GNAT family N-acetyltransferase n=1 Tax=Streptomyces yangpuensis TaxID=1648182 RepID=UPI00381C7C71
MTFDVQRLGPADLGLILGLQERVRSALPDPSVFQTSTPEFIAYCLADGGRCYRVVHDGEPVAYRMVYFPRDRAFNLAKDTSLPPAEYDAVAHWDTVAVLPEWRGHGLARLMNVRALGDLTDTGIRHVLATSSPDNPHGVRTLMEAGFRPVGLVEKFGGKLRFLLYRTYPQPWTAPPALPPGPAPAEPEERLVALSAVAELARAFRDGWSGAALSFDGPDGADSMDGRHAASATSAASAAPGQRVARLRMVRRPLPFRVLAPR